MSDVLFIHGGGDDAHAWDQKIVDRLQALLGPETPIAFPLIEGLEALEGAQVTGELGDVLRAMPKGAIVVAHSVGAAAVLKLLSSGADPKLAALFLLAPPYEGADGEWGETDFSFPADFARRLPKGLPVTLWHSDDDEDIPVDNAHRYAEKMPQAKIVIVHGYGHQFEGKLDFLAKAIVKASQ